MSQRRTRPTMPRPAAALALALCLAALPAAAEFWEAPEALAAGRFPSFFSASSGPVLIWQESQASGDTGKAWIRFARYEGGSWKRGSVSETAYSFTSAGAPPILYSAAQSKDGTIAVAIAASGTSIEVRLSRDGGRSFAAAGSLESSTTSVAPRIFPSAARGWIVFATQGRPSSIAADSAANDAATAAILQSSVSIYSARSVDGSSWSSFEPLVAESEGLPMNFAPFASPLGGKDVVVFQTFILGDEKLSSRYAIMSKTSADGGATWTAAKAMTDFPDPAGGPDSASQNYDNQGAQLAVSGGKLYVAWERRKAKATQTQVWAARVDESGTLDPKTAEPAVATAGSFMLSQIVDSGGVPVILAREDKLKANRVLLAAHKDGRWASEDADLASLSDRTGTALVSFARALETGGRTFLAWQLDGADSARVFAMVPDSSASPPSLSPLNFAMGKRSRNETAELRVDLPKDASGIKAYAYIWKKTGGKAPDLAELWKTGIRREANQASLSLPATADGDWSLWAGVEDNAGNRSALASISYYRKRIPPPAPIVMAPETDERGFLASNSFSIRWIPPEADDLAGYTWDLAFAGPLEDLGRVAASAKAQVAAPALPGMSAYESALLKAIGLRIPPAGVRGTAPAFSASNVDNGYYVFSVSAIDTTGNISGAASILVKAGKYKPYTVVTLAEPSRDDLGRTVLRILGKGFLADGRIERAVLDRNGREPYDIDRAAAKGDFRVSSDRELVGLTFEDAAAGSYRIGLFHSTRGWYWTSPVLAISEAGTVKYSVAAEYRPSFTLFPGRAHPFTIYDVIVLMAVAFALAGILLSSRQVLAVAREGEALRREAIALVTGGPMPQARTTKAARALKRRRSSLRTKFTLTIAFLIIFVVLLLAVSLGYSMVRQTSSALASGLDQRARVLLESVAQGGRYWLGQEQATTQLALFTAQAKTMESADYITITGIGADPKVASGEVVYATSDEAIAAKLDPATLADGKYALGRSAFLADGGKDLLAPLAAAKAKELQDEAAARIADELQLKVRLAQEKAKLAAGKAGDERRGQINAELDAVDLRIRDKLRELSDGAVGSLPPFDPAALTATGATYLYYKPILEYRPSDAALYRGMARLEVNTRQIAADVTAATFSLLKLTLVIAAIALGVGLVGAFILSTVIVVPIRKLVTQIERIRDTENKESLEGSKIEVKSRDELFTLAETVNQMTDGLVRAAKASKELIIGKGIQKMFIPLDPAPGSNKKLSIGWRDEKEFEVFGYYEGADEVSGDYWDFRSINSRYHYFIKCDVSGHGVPAALIMVQVATMVINYFNEWKKIMPKAIDLTDLTYKINDFLEERQFVGRFAAFTLGIWDSQEGIAHLCEAGDRKLHVWDQGAGKLVEETLPDSPAAGPIASFLVQMKQPFVQVTRKLEKGDALFLYTDGIEEANHCFRDKDFGFMRCADAPDKEPHANHKGGDDKEEFGYDRITAIVEAVAARGSYRLERHHDPASELLTFDFSSCDDSLSNKILALVATERVFRFYRAPDANAKDAVVIDEKVDAFLEKHFDQYRLFFSDKRPKVDNENPGYLFYHGIREDVQNDDLTFLGIRRK